MKVKDLIKRLGEFDPELPVCLADWNEDCVAPSEKSAEEIEVVTGQYRESIKLNLVMGVFVVLG